MHGRPGLLERVGLRPVLYVAKESLARAPQRLPQPDASARRLGAILFQNDIEFDYDGPQRLRLRQDPDKIEG